MSSPFILPIFFALFLSTTPMLLLLEAKSFPLSKPNCNQNCGNITIPYPFGMTENCCLNNNFLITCNSSYNPPQPFLRHSNINVTNISLDGQLHILKKIAYICYWNADLPKSNEPIFTLNPQFTINSTANKFIAVGCDTSAFLQGYLGARRKTTGCISFCDYASDVSNGTCGGGGGCCQTSIPENLSNLNLSVSSFYNHTYVQDFNPCSYAFVVEEGEFNFSLDNLMKLKSIEKLPMVLDWFVGDNNETCESARRKMTSCASQNNTICMDSKRPDSGRYRCFCKEGYQGNPYLVNGCQDIDECQLNTNNCTHKELCVNEEGSYRCSCPKGYEGDGRGKEGCSPKNKRLLRTWILAAGIPAGTLVSLAGCCWGYFWMKKKQLLWIKEKNLEKNGGKILKEKQKGSSVIVRTFTAEELKKATNNYHKSTIIGQGGNGIVYSGRLKEKKEVAIKKSRTVDHDQIDQFINEVTLLSRTHHKNVVELLGCCLEDEVPLLVYEFISNGTLYQHLHKKNDANYVLKWDVRLRIAAETANALSYLHSAASPPIIHRDVKTANILLDENWTAKVADFGASRLVPLNESQISTMVLGTFGYLDPEYFQTGQLTGKSDVYSFGVVLVELLTGKLPVSYDRPENERSLANLFLSSLKQNNLVEILDPNISFSEVQIEVAMLAKRCLNVKGEDRPTMEEVSTELKGLLKANHCPIPDANWNSEEIQSVEDALISVDSLMATTSTFSVEKQNIILPLLVMGDDCLVDH